MSQPSGPQALLPPLEKTGFMAKVLDWKKSDDVRDIVHLSVQALAEGHMVILPTCTSYVAAAIATNESAMANLASLAEAQAVQTRELPDLLVPPAALVVRNSHELLDFGPKACSTALRIAKRAWPGPAQLLTPGNHVDSLLSRLPQPTLDLVINQSGEVRLCQPAHQAVQEVARMSAGPLVILPLSSPKDGSLVVTGQNAMTPLASILVDSGPTKYQGRPTLLQVIENQCRIVQNGVTSQAELQSLSRLFVMLVCTGNTCRSPMAEKLLESKVRAAFRGSIAAESPDPSSPSVPSSFLPVYVVSAGIAAGGGPASPQAIAAMQERGLDLSDHQSCAVTEKEIGSADLILAMTRSHLQTIISRWPHVAGKAFLLCTEGIDVSDPFGGPVSIYRDCADRISEYLDNWIERLSSMPLPKWPEA